MKKILGYKYKYKAQDGSPRSSHRIRSVRRTATHRNSDFERLSKTGRLRPRELFTCITVTKSISTITAQTHFQYTKLHLPLNILSSASKLKEDMGGKSANKAGYFDKLKGLLEEYKSIFIVGVDNVSSQQMHEIRQSLRGKAVVLMGKNTMVCRTQR